MPIRESLACSSGGEAKPSNVRIFLADILTFHGFFGAKFDILKPRWLPTLGLQPGINRHFENSGCGSITAARCLS